MKISPFLLFISLTAACALAQEYNLTPSTLADWHIRGAESISPAKSNGFVVPSGAQVGRNFVGGTIVVCTISSPTFGETPDNSPVVSLGGAALALVRTENVGHVVLVVGETITVLPQAIPLTDDGRSRQPLELLLAVDPVSGRGVAGVPEGLSSFDSPPESKGAEVTVAAGAQADWPYDSLAVSVVPNVSENRDVRPTTASAPSPEEWSQILAALTRPSGDDSHRDSSATSGATAPGVVKTQSSSAEGTFSLEVFTPPSVRLTPATVRAALTKSSQK